MQITQIAPDKGHTGGRTLVEIRGTGFREPGEPDPGVFPAVLKPSMQVFFGDTPALDVAVESTECVFAVSPPCPIPMIYGAGKDDLPFPAKVSITVKNLDDDGNPISGEEATVEDAFEYLRPDLSKPIHAWSVVVTMLYQLKLQIHPNVTYAVHSDFGGFGNAINLAYTATLPGLVILSVAFRDSEIRRQGPKEVPAKNSGEAVRKNEGLEQDVLFEILGVANDMDELGALMLTTRMFFQNNNKLLVRRNPTDPSAGYIGYTVEFSWGNEMRLATTDSNANLANFTISAAIRNVVLEEMPGLPEAGTTHTATGSAHEGASAPIYTVETVEILKEKL